MTVKQTTVAATGNTFVAEAFRQIAPDALFAYPITPQTTIVEEYARYVANGRVHTEYVTVESEHSSLSAAIASSAAGARTVTATSSQGLAYMWEELHVASGLRTPVIMANANRAISAPINIHCDHSDIMGARDTGWIILFAETAQEAYDNTIIVTKAAEANSLPGITALDGFITTHAIARGELVEDEVVKNFVGDFTPKHALLDPENPVMVGGFANLGNSYFEIKKAQRSAIDNSLESIGEIGAEWATLVDRPYLHVEGYEMDDADFAIVVIGSTAGNVRAVVKELRAEGVKAGVLKVRTFRPFPVTALVDALKGCKAIAVLDRSDSFGAPAGPLALDVMGALYENNIHVPLRPYIYGLGGADVKLDHIRSVYTELDHAAQGEPSPGLIYLGAR